MPTVIGRINASGHRNVKFEVVQSKKKIIVVDTMDTGFCMIIDKQQKSVIPYHPLAANEYECSFTAHYFAPDRKQYNRVLREVNAIMKIRKHETTPVLVRAIKQMPVPLKRVTFGGVAHIKNNGTVRCDSVHVPAFWMEISL
jgi:hypothetical protein